MTTNTARAVPVERNLSLGQWYTPPELAARLWQFATRHRPAGVVLEPSAGRGALLRPIIEAAGDVTRPAPWRIIAVDIDEQNVEHLRDDIKPRCARSLIQCDLLHGDFLNTRETQPSNDNGTALGAAIGGGVDLVLMNPPYENGGAEAFIREALRYAPRVVGIFKASILFGVERHKSLWSECHTTREVRLMARPSFGRGETGASGKTDFVALEIVAGATPDERGVQVEQWLL